MFSPNVNTGGAGRTVLRKSVGSTIVAPPDEIAKFMHVKKISMSPRQFERTFIAYKAETEGGSSGSGIISKSGREVDFGCCSPRSLSSHSSRFWVCTTRRS
jgi:hypothetical protein